MIEFKNVKLNIKNIDVCNDVSFKIENNTTSCFLGNKNAGKSSILKMLAGVYKNYFGEIIINGVDLDYNKDVRIDLAHDNVEKDKNLTTNDYLEFYGSIYDRMQKKELDDFIDKKLRDFSLMSYKHTNLNLLDKETFKLIDIIRVLINDPDIILFDNLFFSDSVEYRETVTSFLNSIQHKKTIIFASRNLNNLENFVDNIGVIERGVLIEFGKKNDVFKKANILQRIEVEVIGDIESAINVLEGDERVINMIFDRNVIVFSIANENYSLTEKNIKNIEYDLLKKLIDRGVKVNSFKTQLAKFSELFMETQ